LCQAIGAVGLTVLVSASAGAAVASPLDLVGWVPDVGQSKDVAIAPSGLAYVASTQFGLAAVDITNPSFPVVVSTADTAFDGEHVAVNGSVAVVTSGTLGLTVLDVSNARQRAPQVVGYVPGTFRAVTLAGSTAYVLQVVSGNPATTYLTLLDLTNPVAPSITGRVAVGGGTLAGVRVIGSLAFVAAGVNGLRIVDVSNPAAPTIIGTAAINSAEDVDVVNGYAYVADGGSLAVFDVHTPSQPTLVSLQAIQASTVVASNNRLYVLGGTSLEILDITAPAAPRLLNSSSNFGAQGLAVLGTDVYLASPAVNSLPGPTNPGGLYALDVSTGTPVVLTNIYNGFGNAGVAVDGAFAVATGGLWGLTLVNVGVPTAPAVVGGVDGTFGAVAMAGSVAYLLETVSGNPAHVNLDVLDVSYLNAHHQGGIVGSLTIGTSASDVKIAGTVVYVAAGGGGLQIIDVSTPSRPTLLATQATPSAATSVAVGTGYAYVGTGTSIYVVDVHVPTHPAIVGSIATAASELATANQLIYALDGQHLKIIDATNIAAPVQLGAVASTAQAVGVTGTWALLAQPALDHSDPGGGVYLIDVSNPAQPEVIDQAIVPGTTRSIALANNLVYAGDSASIIDVLTLSGSPIASTPTPRATASPTRSSQTPTRTVSAQATPTPSTATVAGQIVYYSNGLPVGNATVQLTANSGNVMQTQTNTGGQFGFAGVGSGNWRLMPQKSGDFGNAIGVLDAVYAIQASLGLRTLTTTQQLACAVAGNGSVAVLDAVLILQHSLGLLPTFPAAQACGSDWAFIPQPATVPNQALMQPTLASGTCQPGAITYQPLVGSATNQNFNAVLFGDCSGQWQPSGITTAARAATTSHEVRLGPPARRRGLVSIPLAVRSTSPFEALDVTLTYDPTRLTLVEVAGTAAAGQALLETNSSVPGTLRLALASGTPLQNGSLLRLHFQTKSRNTKPVVRIVRATLISD